MKKYSDLLKENQQGKGPSQIFLENGFDLAVIGEKKPKQCLKRWRRTFEQFGEEGFYTERRGKGSTGRPSEKPLSSDEKLKKGLLRNGCFLNGGQCPIVYFKTPFF